MLITADWVLPVSRPPIRNGAVLVRRGLVAEVGRAADLVGLDSDDVRHFEGCVLTPGLVNAHTHLALTALRGLLGEGSFESWLPRLVTAVSGWERDDHAASASLGVVECLRSGITVVGDVTYGPEAPSAAADCGLGGTFYWEILGITAPRLFAELERMEFPGADRGTCGSRIRCGLSPHAPYTSEPRLIAAMHEAARDFDTPYAIHLAESAAEVEFVRAGTGPLADVASRMAPDFEAAGLSPVAYVDQLGALDGTTVVHACHVGPADIARLASTVRGVVTCPRSNRFLGNPVPPVTRLLRAGVPVGVGTDSLASNDDLDLMKDVRHLHAEFPSVPAPKLIEMVTAMGAIALGIEDRFGILETGMQADIALFGIGPTDDPETDFVRTAGAENLRAVMSAGTWRIIDGEHAIATESIELAAQASRIRARSALEQA
jgi:5-methylthioadenosine/S-adenosylhomocysteine deaminase